jgi:hypothetical protein
MPHRKILDAHDVKAIGQGRLKLLVGVWKTPTIMPPQQVADSAARNSQRIQENQPPTANPAHLSQGRSQFRRRKVVRNGDTSHDVKGPIGQREHTSAADHGTRPQTFLG